MPLLHSLFAFIIYLQISDNLLRFHFRFLSLDRTIKNSLVNCHRSDNFKFINRTSRVGMLVSAIFNMWLYIMYYDFKLRPMISYYTI